MKIYTPIILVLIYTGLVLYLSSFSSKIGFTFSGNKYVNQQVNYQILLLGIAIISILSSYFLNPESLKSLVTLGNISAPAKEVKLFGIAEGDTWLKTGISLSFFITLITGLFLYFHLKQQVVDYSLLKTGIFWIVLFSLANSFSEEMIYRLGINAPLNGLLQPNTIFLISGIIFGIAHFQGVPNGLVGIILSGVLGYILSKSVYETQGIFWAWLIHFLQDVLIFSSLYLLNSKA